MRVFGLIVLSLGVAVLSTDWYVCFIKQQCSVGQKPQIIQQAKAAPEPKVIKKTESVDDKIEIIKGRIHFKSGAKKFLTSKKVQKYLKHVANEWKKDPSQKISVLGHTDNKGSRKANYKLGLYRSQSIKKALVVYGVDKSAIYTKSLGESKPMSSNRTRKGRFFNRRVEINLK